MYCAEVHDNNDRGPLADDRLETAGTERAEICWLEHRAASCTRALRAPDVREQLDVNA